MEYQVGIDIGGTFTDCAVATSEGEILSSKVPTTANPADGFFDALERMAERIGISTPELLKASPHLVHGTTVATNAFAQKRGAKVGLITTRGHRDAIHMMRSIGRVAGLPPELQIHAAGTSKPDPIVPRSLIAEVSERVDFTGDVVVPFNEEEAIEARDMLLAEGVEAVAVCFLWSFLNPDHEQRMRDLLLEAQPDLFVSVSSAVAAKAGEYERTAATAVNAYVGPLTSSYIASLDERLHEAGYGSRLRVTQCTGGVLSASEAALAPLLLLESGPVAGVVGSQQLARAMGQANVIATDMGGTTFDAGLIVDGRPVETSTTVMGQYEFYLPAVEVQSIGSGGGSLARVEEPLGLLKVGPHSAGAIPGPACYGKGGELPTVTDSDVLLGYLNPAQKLGGSIELDPEAAEAAIAPLAERLGLSAIETAAGIVRIVDSQMADAIRTLTVSRGYDPRDFVLFAYGGAGPVHAGGYAAQLGGERIIVPRGDLSSVWSAFGCATGDIVHMREARPMLKSPFDPAALAKVRDELVERARASLDQDGIDPETASFQASVEIRFKAQAHEITVPLGLGELGEADIAALEKAFMAAYEQRFGRGAGYREAAMELVTVRARGIGPVAKPEFKAPDGTGGSSPDPAGSRQVYWPAYGEKRDTPAFDGPSLAAGAKVEGPAIFDYPDTAVVIHPGQRAEVDPVGNIVVQLPSQAN
jgi:N-methylhydantoinase A